MNSRILSGWLLVIGLGLIGCKGEDPRCYKDSDCSGDRICDASRQCVDPSGRNRGGAGGSAGSAGEGGAAGDWGPCSLDSGVGGQCLPTNQCDEGMRSVPGHCPGPADIQCCVPMGGGGGAAGEGGGGGGGVINDSTCRERGGTCWEHPCPNDDMGIRVLVDDADPCGDFGLYCCRPLSYCEQRGGQCISQADECREGSYHDSGGDDGCDATDPDSGMCCLPCDGAGGEDGGAGPCGAGGEGGEGGEGG